MKWLSEEAKPAAPDVDKRFTASVSQAVLDQRHGAVEARAFGEALENLRDARFIRPPLIARFDAEIVNLGCVNLGYLTSRYQTPVFRVPEYVAPRFMHT